MTTCITVLLVSATLAAQAPVPHLPPLDRVWPKRADAIDQQLAARVDPAVAMDTVRTMAPHWQLAGNPAFEQSQQFIFDRLKAGGFTPTYAFSDAGVGRPRHLMCCSGAASRTTKRSRVSLDFVAGPCAALARRS